MRWSCSSTQILSLLALSGSRLCLCGLSELRYGPWGVTLLLLHLLHLLLVLAAGEENSGLCRQHKHTCCCCCCCLSAAFDAAAVAAYFVLLLWLLPLMCPPYVSLERKNVFRNTNSCSTCSPALFSSKRHCIENRKVLLPCSACCIKREVSEDNTKERGQEKGPPEQAGCRAGIRRRAERR